MPSTPEEVTRDAVAIRGIFKRATEIFLSRNSKYKSAFRVGGVVDNAFQLRHKAIRMLQKAQDYEHYLTDPESYVRGYGRKAEIPSIDDAYDLINYAAFLIICINQDIWPKQLDETSSATVSVSSMEGWMEAKYAAIRDDKPSWATPENTMIASDDQLRADGVYVLAIAWTGTCDVIEHDGKWYVFENPWHGNGGDFLWDPPVLEHHHE